MPRILLTQAIHPDVQRALAALGAVDVAPDQRPDTLRRLAASADTIVVRAPLPDDVFDAAPRLIGAVRHGAGVDMIPIAQATAHGVLVANVPGANAQSVAEYVVGAMIMLARRFPRIERDLREAAAGWSVARAHADQGRELSGTTVGIVGFGQVGRRIAGICANGFGMQVLATGRTPLQPTAEATAVTLEELLARSDWVVLALPLHDGTRGLIDRRRIGQMKPGASLINVARGAVVDEAELLAALLDGRLGGAALDVFQRQPLAPDHPLCGLDNVVLTPHLAGISEPSMLRMGQGAAAAVGAILAGRRPVNLVNPEAWEAFAARYAQR